MPTTWSFERDGAQTSIALTGRVTMSEVREAVLAHMGLTVGSTWMFSPELANGAIEEVLTQ